MFTGDICTDNMPPRSERHICVAITENSQHINISVRYNKHNITEFNYESDVYQRSLDRRSTYVILVVTTFHVLCGRFEINDLFCGYLKVFHCFIELQTVSL